jgi:hypothetical protein
MANEERKLRLHRKSSIRGPAYDDLYRFCDVGRFRIEAHGTGVVPNLTDRCWSVRHRKAKAPIAYLLTFEQALRLAAQQNRGT